MRNVLRQLHILIVDDEKSLRDELEQFLSDSTFMVFKAGFPSQAFNIIEHNNIDIVILDVNLPEMSGFQLLELIKRDYPDIEVIMISSFCEVESVIHAMRLGVSDFFTKPFHLKEVGCAIERTNKFVGLNKSLKEAQRNHSIVSKVFQKQMGCKIIGDSLYMKNLMNLIGRVAKTERTSVLITGESGTGKELVARAIHYLSSRKDSSFYAVNCSAIPESLFESEFFGHTRGAFTGARENKLGWFETANNGSLFLDEIGDMQLSLQTKLLRVLEEHKIRKIGSNVQIPFDARIIAATNQDIKQLLKVKGFRLDLYHRLSTFVIHIDPLRKRKADIPPLVNHFVGHFNEMMGKSINEVDEKVVLRMMEYDFPGNVRELKNMVERAVILCDSNKLTLRHLHFMEADEHMDITYCSAQEEFDLQKMERRCILRALEKTNYNKSKAATLLKISWQSLDRRIKKHNLIL